MQTIESADSKLTQITLPVIDTYLLTRAKPSSCSSKKSCILVWICNNFIEPAILLLSKNVNYVAISFGLTDPYFDICNGIWDMNSGMLLLSGKIYWIP